VGDTGYGLGVAAGDYDNDGCPDLFVNNFGRNVLYRNNGNGTFTDVTNRAGVQRSNENLVGAGACFLDIDGDGNLELYVGNYSSSPTTSTSSASSAASPPIPRPSITCPPPTPSIATTATAPSPT